MDKRFWGIIAAIVVILGAIFIITNHGNNTSSGNGQPTNHVEGQGADGITLLEYGDYQCPYCGEYYPIVKQVAAIYDQDIYFQFRNLPLTQLHPNAYAGARAAEAASLQGKFWQMHDLLYEQNGAYYDSNETLANWIGSSNPENDFVQYAQQLGLNVSQFKTDYASGQVNNSILADMNAFTKTGAEEATPTFFLNGTQINPSISVSSFETIINAAIQKKTGHSSGISVSTTPSTATAPKSTQ
ncbi:MAG TPA: thioredoxin domain-containing protein [Candidatus Binatia bacterium]|nr:thioredoxin domain-containing protein [Candidatus Binatia bacterium]